MFKVSGFGIEVEGFGREVVFALLLSPRRVFLDPKEFTSHLLLLPAAMHERVSERPGRVQKKCFFCVASFCCGSAPWVYSQNPPTGAVIYCSRRRQKKISGNGQGAETTTGTNNTKASWPVSECLVHCSIDSQSQSLVSTAFN